MKRDLYPVGSRPRCLHRHKELKPNYRWKPVPFGLDVQARKQWKKVRKQKALDLLGMVAKHEGAR